MSPSSPVVTLDKAAPSLCLANTKRQPSLLPSSFTSREYTLVWASG